MAGYTYANLTTDIRNYTEVDSNVFTAAVINRFLENAEHRINLDCPMDSDRIQAEAQFAQNFNSITVPNTPNTCLLYTSPSPRDRQKSRMPSSA